MFEVFNLDRVLHGSDIQSLLRTGCYSVIEVWPFVQHSVSRGQSPFLAVLIRLSSVAWRSRGMFAGV